MSDKTVTERDAVERERAAFLAGIHLREEDRPRNGFKTMFCGRPIEEEAARRYPLPVEPLRLSWGVLLTPTRNSLGVWTFPISENGNPASHYYSTPWFWVRSFADAVAIRDYLAAHPEMEAQ